MASKYQEALQKLALENDPDTRLVLAASLDTDAEDLNERWDTRDQYNSVAAERDTLISERDEWKSKYANRFFDSDEGKVDEKKINTEQKVDVNNDSKTLGFGALWNEM